MIRYHEYIGLWISGKNPDDQGFPSTNLTGDEDLCWCLDCRRAYRLRLGENFGDLPKAPALRVSIEEIQRDPNLLDKFSDVD